MKKLKPKKLPAKVRRIVDAWSDRSQYNPNWGHEQWLKWKAGK